MKSNGYRAVFGVGTVNLTLAVASVPITTETSDTIGEARMAFKFTIIPLTSNFLITQREATTVVRKFSWAQPLSEIESQNVRNAIFSVASQSKCYLTFHSYGQDMLIPWSYETTELPVNYDNLVRITALTLLINLLFLTEFLETSTTWLSMLLALLLLSTEPLTELPTLSPCMVSMPLH
jgi:hypothetical protein